MNERNGRHYEVLNKHQLNNKLLNIMASIPTTNLHIF